MQIREIVLYGKNGQVRHLKFQIGKLNIIIGEPKSGNSTVGNIIDYCLGSSKCNIADGVVRDSVAWFGVLLQFPMDRIFIARKNPENEKQATASCYYEIGENIEVPESEIIAPNTNVEGIIEILNEHIGIGENMHIPPKGQTRSPLTATVRHALGFCFQEQNEIASKNILFHGASEPFVLQGIKDTLPYFLGAVREDALMLTEELRLKKRDLRSLRQKEEEAELLRGNNITRARELLNEAIAVGLIGNTDDVAQEKDFRKIVELLSDCKIENKVVEYTESSKLNALQKLLDDARKRLNDIDREIELIEQYMSGSSGYRDEIKHQKVRLESIGLFENIDFRPDRCPFCSNELSTPLPEVDLLKQSIIDLDKNLKSIEKRRPKLQTYINDLYTKRYEIHKEIAQLRTEIDSVYQIEEDVCRVQDMNVNKAKIIGRISLWLESVNELEEDNELEGQINNLQSRIDEIQQLLDSEAVKDRMESFLSKMQIDMTSWARYLELEHSEYPYRYDQNKGTVVDKDRPVTLNQLGSGSNWVGVHLITYMAFHKQFIENNRPVPRFLFLDQPSQVYFSTSPDDRDMEAVTKIYQFLAGQVETYNGKFQIIVVDHAELKEPCFQNNIVEVWRGDKKLIPIEWYEN